MKKREFERYYSRLYMPLSMYALRLSGDLDEAKDIVQDAFADMWARIENGAQPESFKAYIYRMVRNACLRRCRPGFERIEEMEADVPEEVVDTSERDAILWRAVDSLPDRCRAIFLLSKRDGLSNSEIAAELSISVKTVENQMTKAFASLRNALAQSGGKSFFLPFL